MSHLFSLLLFFGCTAAGVGRYLLLRRRELLLGQTQKNACLSDPVPESSLAGEPLPPLYGEG